MAPPAMALIALTHLQASSGEWVGSVSGRGGHSRLVSGCPARVSRQMGRASYST